MQSLDAGEASSVVTTTTSNKASCGGATPPLTHVQYTRQFDRVDAFLVDVVLDIVGGDFSRWMLVILVGGWLKRRLVTFGLGRRAVASAQWGWGLQQRASGAAARERGMWALL